MSAAESNVTQLTALFPDIERDILEMMLEHHGSVERVVSALLDENDDDALVDASTDDAVARNLQENIDEELARALQQELNREGASDPPASPTVGAAGQTAAAAAEKVVAGTKRLASTLQERIRRMSTKSRGAHAQRLLDDAAQSPDYNEPFQPLQPLYTPPTPHSSPLTTPPPTSSTRIGGDPAAPDDPTAPSAEGSAPTPSKYTSRVERARLANRTKAMSTAQPMPSSLMPIVAANAPSPIIPPVTQGPVEVPVGELI
jgi:hypothetical protein